jgi:hypothetical protein
MPPKPAFPRSLNRLQTISGQLGTNKPYSSLEARPQIQATQHISTPIKMTTTDKSPAPWRDLLKSHMDQTPGYEFTIATVGFDENQRPIPRVRTCGYRGFFPELKLHPKSQEDMEQQVKDGGNPETYESDMLCFTTDIRMEKLDQLETSGHAVEAVFWLKDLMTQWRVKGKAFAIGDPRGGDFDGEKDAREELHASLRVKENYGGSIGDWTWERAVTKYFANHSPLARGMLLSSLLSVWVSQSVCF